MYSYEHNLLASVYLLWNQLNIVLKSDVFPCVVDAKYIIHFCFPIYVFLRNFLMMSWSMDNIEAKKVLIVEAQ